MAIPREEEDIMSTDRTYVTQNDAERSRLRSLVARLSDADLARPMPAGWTVAAVLAHLAFWDQRILVLLEQWEHSPSASPPLENAADVDWINDATKPLFLALTPRRAAEVAVGIAEAVDRKVAALSDDFLARNKAAGSPLNMVRAEHRREHLQEIEQIFG
ncbi:MAG TPA: maleylpyruvate isomerase N-terminal domain-containing protein [Methylomirabilota bacterium]|jgi:hypothetical protein|nr:maleylpyruvate isomerase N-terminal domain-containing protein [Methylomirabilota bacterium]